jgi:hypothetical protein
VICLECEAPSYVFEWREDKLIDALCTTCGNDDATQFVTEEEYEEMAMDTRFWPDRKA